MCPNFRDKTLVHPIALIGIRTQNNPIYTVKGDSNGHLRLLLTVTLRRFPPFVKYIILLQKLPGVYQQFPKRNVPAPVGMEHPGSRPKGTHMNPQTETPVAN